jgi:Metallo-peptidase family M12B Reprolysin-like/Secretion system C-terminal sorting domain/Putative binding domain, N-terminal/Viral BACON domain
MKQQVFNLSAHIESAQCPSNNEGWLISQTSLKQFIIQGFMLMFFCLSVPILAQSNETLSTFYGKPVTYKTAALSKHFHQYEVYELDSRALAEFAQSKTGVQTFRLTLADDYNWHVKLIPQDIRSTTYRSAVLTSKGREEMPIGKNTTFTGAISSGEQVSLSLNENFIYGFIGAVFIEPLSHFDSDAPADRYIVYKVEDIVPNTNTRCGATDKEHFEKDYDVQPESLLATGCRRVRLAVAADFSMFQKYGSAARVNQYILGVMNNVQTLYTGVFNFDNESVANDNIIFEVSESIVISNSSQGFSFITSINALSVFSIWALGSTGFTRTFDLGQFWTNQVFEDAHVVGRAYLDAVCSSNKFHVLRDFSTNAMDMRVLTAHEIGHNFGADHNSDNAGFIMDPLINSRPTRFTAESLRSINASIPNFTCLANCASFLSVNPTSINAPATGGFYNIAVAASGSWSAVSNNGAIVTIVNNSANGNGNGTLFLNITANTTSSTRSTSVVVTSGSLSQTINIIQAGNGCSDPYESNNSLTAAYTIGAVSSTYSSPNLCLMSGDRDFIRFSAAGKTFYAHVRGYSTTNVGQYKLLINVSGSVLTVQTAAVSGGANLDTYLELYGENTQILGSDDDGSINQFSLIRYTIPQPPALSVNPTSISAPATGGSYNIAVTASGSWSALSNNGAIATIVNGTANGNGNGTLTINITANATTSARMTSLVVTSGSLSQTINITQAPDICTDTYETNNSFNTAYNIGTVSSTFSSPNLCLTTADNDYIRFTAVGKTFYARVRGYSTTNVGQYKLVISISGNVLTVQTAAVSGGAGLDTFLDLYNDNTQSLGSNDDGGGGQFSLIRYTIQPTLSVTPTSISAPATGGPYTIAVTASSSWSAVSNNGAIATIVNGTANGNGNGNLTINITANATTSARMTSVVVTSGSLSQTINITQAAAPPPPCTDSYEPNNSFNTAHNLNGGWVGSTLNACLTTSDYDYFRFIAAGKTFYTSVHGYNNAVGQYKLNINLSGNSITIRTLAVSGSADLDTYLTLYGTNTQPLASDDDSGDNRFSLIRYTIPTSINGDQDESTASLFIQSSTTQEVKSKSLMGDAHKLIIAPNPNNGSFKLNYEAESDELADIDIVDLTGKVVHSEKTQLLTGANSIALNNVLKQGMYWVRLKTPTFYLTERLIIVK